MCMPCSGVCVFAVTAAGMFGRVFMHAHHLLDVVLGASIGLVRYELMISSTRTSLHPCETRPSPLRVGVHTSAELAGGKRSRVACVC
jgi:hypothetical protein